MEPKIVEKAAFAVRGISRIFRSEQSHAEIPQFWDEVCHPGQAGSVCGMFGICIGSDPGADEFEYMIADAHKEGEPLPAGMTVKNIPAYTWAVFACRGAIPGALQQLQGKIFSEWLPNCGEYEIAAGYNIEMYSDPTDHPRGMQDDDYYCEVWIPVKRK